MKTDYRKYQRFPVDCDVILSCHSFGMISGNARDLSLNGVFVTTKFVNLAENELVDVCFSVTDNKRKSLHTVGAKVARVSKNGVGLRFINDMPRALYAALN